MQKPFRVLKQQKVSWLSKGKKRRICDRYVHDNVQGTAVWPLPPGDRQKWGQTDLELFPRLQHGLVGLGQPRPLVLPSQLPLWPQMLQCP